jgi:methionine biosynthesis protein MetW
MSKERLEDFRWDNHSQTLQEKHKLAYSLFRTIPEYAKAEICDVGCGDGFFLLEGVITIGRRVGVDFSQVAVQKCKAKGLEAFRVDVEKEPLPFRDKEFDVVFLIDVLEHVWQPELLLREAGRVGRYVILTVPNFSFAKDRLQCLFGRVPQSMGAKKGHCFFMNWKSLNEVVDKAGLKIKKIEYYFPLNNSITRTIGRINPSLFSTMFGVLLE